MFYKKENVIISLSESDNYRKKMIELLISSTAIDGLPNKRSKDDITTEIRNQNLKKASLIVDYQRELKKLNVPKRYFNIYPEILIPPQILLDKLESYNSGGNSEKEIDKCRVDKRIICRKRRRLVSKLRLIDNAIVKLIKEERNADRLGGISSCKGSYFLKCDDVIIMIAPSIHFRYFFSSLIEFNLKHPEFFGKGAQSLLNHFYIFLNERGDFQNYGYHFLKDNEEFEIALKQSFCYYGSKEHALRLDFYRNIVLNSRKKEPNDMFEGGLLHALRHFKNRYDEPISSSYEGGSSFREEYFEQLLITGFFLVPKDERTSKGFVSKVNYKGQQTKLSFYENSRAPGIHFLNTVYRVSKK